MSFQTTVVNTQTGVTRIFTGRTAKAARKKAVAAGFFPGIGHYTQTTVQVS